MCDDNPPPVTRQSAGNGTVVQVAQKSGEKSVCGFGAGSTQIAFLRSQVDIVLMLWKVSLAISACTLIVALYAALSMHNSLTTRLATLQEQVGSVSLQVRSAATVDQQLSPEERLEIQYQSEVLLAKIEKILDRRFRDHVANSK